MNDQSARMAHPAIIDCPYRFIALTVRVALVLFIVGVMAFIAGCAPTAYQEQNPPVKLKPTIHSAQTAKKAGTVVSAPSSLSGTKRVPILNVGKDDEIPTEYAGIISDRSARNITRISKMCGEAAAGYCDAPNVAHCHGAFCHAHPNGQVRHTHEAAEAMPPPPNKAAEED